MGHMHQSIVAPAVDEYKLTSVNGTIKRRPVTTRQGWYYAAPSMFTTYPPDASYPSYAEMKIYPATDLGWIEIVVNDKGEIQAIEEYYDNGDLRAEHKRTVIS